MPLPYGTKIKMHSTESLANIEGIIVGVATQDQPVIGPSYIVQPKAHNFSLNHFISDEYRYTHFCSFASQFDVI